ncbi:MAG TPA: LuxR C-terminal-related transcriptional regulator [Chloroflexia bacterium]|nr:LuxR C-terminal-related transcriptional regulator [Chloroflexia bacterium]
MQHDPPSNAPNTAAPQRPADLPGSVTPLIGREREQASLGRLVQRTDVRLVTLTGPGGVGKTSLALQVAAQVAAAWADGVRFCPLAAVSDADLIVPTINQALGLRDTSGSAPLSVLKDYLRDRHLLLVLDNFEHLVAAAPLIADLLGACPRLAVLTTSRAPLRVRGEYEFPVLPLALPESGALGAGPLVVMEQYPAVALFIERAQAARPTFTPGAADLPVIVAICRRLDGLPLAIELAAARIKLLSLPDLLARLTGSAAPATATAPPGRLQLLTGGARDLPARQQTMRATIRWSYDLLAPDEQQLFRRLSVFAGDCPLDGAAVVAGASTSPEDHPGVPVLDQLTALVDSSLVQLSEPGPDSAQSGPRLQMLEMIHEFGLECLQAAGEAPAVRAAHAAYYLALAEAAGAALSAGESRIAIQQLERENANLRSALGWALEHSPDTLLRLCAALWRFWRLRGYQTEGRRWLDAALAAFPAGPHAAGLVHARVLEGAATLALYLNDYGQLRILSERCLALAMQLGDPRGQAAAFKLMAMAARVAMDLPTARGYHQRSRALLATLDDWHGVGEALQMEATTILLLGDPAEALALSRESLALSRAHHDQGGIGYALGTAAYCLATLGRYAEARAILTEEALPLVQALGHRTAIGRSLNILGSCALGTGDYGAAAAYYEQALAIHREMGDRIHIATCLGGLAQAALAGGRVPTAARLCGALEALLAALDTPLARMRSAGVPRLHQALVAQLGEAQTAALVAEGARAGVDSVLAGYHADDGPPAAPQPAPAPPPTALDGLTAREVAVLRLMAQGLTNKQIGDQLVISPHTVGTHLRAIFDKLGVTTRAAATRYALEHHLV